MPDRSNVVYLYDGTFEGLLCCVFESYAAKELPVQIYCGEQFTPTLYPVKLIETDLAKARRVYLSLPKNISADAPEIIFRGFLTCHPQKELLLLDFIRLGIQEGSRAVHMLTHNTVSQLYDAIRRLIQESRHLMGFIRFSVYDGKMVSVIEPKNCVLPLICDHFVSRLPEETFLIFDKPHKLGFFYHPGQKQGEFLSMDDIVLPSPEDQELEYRRLWRGFFQAIGIQERLNPCCQRNHLPKRFRPRLTEFYEPETLLPAEPPHVLLKHRPPQE